MPSRPNRIRADVPEGAERRKAEGEKYSLTAKDAEGAEEGNSLTAKDAKAAKRSIIKTKP
jgi:hypothetical protein